ncbi:MAG TPA: MFS transporter [Stellaceae bacterium]|nr:MFS transporter [Stellaceae bacterium]
MADMQAGIGPFLGVFLAEHGWGTGAIGTVITIGGVAGMVVTAPAGALIDRTRRKRGYIVVTGAMTVLASAVVFWSQSFWLVAASQVASAVAGAALGPALVGLTLGIVRQRGFNGQNGHNQAFNHAGNMVGAGLAGLLGWHFGFAAVLWLAAFFGVLSMIAVLSVPRAAIDDAAARGLERHDGAVDRPKGFSALLESKPLCMLALCLALFHLGNAAMLPLYGMAVAASHPGSQAPLVALTVVIAQGTMIAMSVLAMRLAERRGYWLVILITFIALPIRGYIAAHLITAWGIYPVQILDGVGAGLQSVAVPGLVARILDGTGRVNLGQGAVMTVQGIGASLSPALGGWIAQVLGYPVAFMLLGSLSLLSLMLWLACAPMLRPACARV